MGRCFVKTNPNSKTQVKFFPDGDDIYSDFDHGLTKLEYFSSKAMQGLLSNSSLNWTSYETAEYAVTCAKSLIERLNKQ